MCVCVCIYYYCIAKTGSYPWCTIHNIRSHRRVHT